MHWKTRRWTLVNILVVAMAGLAAVWPLVAVAQMATTQITDTVYHADGTAATGTVIVSWAAFTAASGETVPTGNVSATISTGGALTLALAPNAGATPMGSYYTAVYHLDDGSVSREYWVVPVSLAAVTLSSIRSTVLPTSVAMQTVSKAYVDTAIAAAVTGHPLDSTPYVLKAGDTMTGPLVLPADPTTSNQAADKHYVDVSVTGTTGGLAQKVSTIPSATQTVAQPAGTQLQVNLMNGAVFASQYVSGEGDDGIANAAASPDCVNGCEMVADASYVSAENYIPQNWASSATSGTHLEDTRGGGRQDNYFNPVDQVHLGSEAGQKIDVVSTRSTASVFQQTASQESGSFGLVISHEGLAGGSNLFPAALETVPYFKTGYSALNITGTYNTLGQHVLAPHAINCYGVGDCLIGGQFLTAAGGFRDEADEGTHPFDISVAEDTLVFAGTCSTGCTAGSTMVKVSATVAPGTQGEGRYLIDKNTAHVLTAGTLTGGATGAVSATATFSGTAFPASVFFMTATLIPSQANNIAPGTVSVAIASSGVPSGFVTNTGALSGSSGVACVADRPNGFEPHNYEMANYTIVDGTHLQMTLNKVHAVQATIAVGGLCGYGLEQTVDTVRGIRQVFPVIGSYAATGLYYAGHVTSVIGVSGDTSGFLNISLSIAAIARSGNVVTVTTAGSAPADLNGLTLTVAGVADSSYNGSFVVNSTGQNTLTYTQTGANSTSSAGTIGILTGGYALYPMAEVLSVYNATSKQVDGQMTLAPNLVQWAASDLVEEPHYYEEKVSGDTQFIAQTTPRPTTFARSGIEYDLSAGPGTRGWSVTNGVAASNYLGNGGTHTIPDIAYEALGIWRRDFDLQAGDESVLSVHCNSHGCGRWNSGYALFELDSNAGVDSLGYLPQTSTMNLNLRGTNYQFSPLAFTAGTINATTVNATTLNGSVSAAQLPVFIASGSGHSQGAVPDPGVTAGATRFLREDSVWVAPTGTGGAGALPVSGATSDYRFLNGSGSTVTDASGSGNNATLGSGGLAPAWVTNGLAFTYLQNVLLPAALNNSQTLCGSVYMTPISLTVPPNQYPALVTSSLGAAGVNLLYIKSPNLQPSFAPSITAGGTNTTLSLNLTSGYHDMCYLLGTGGGNLDHVYLDGQEVTYTAQGSSYGNQTSGNLLLGSSGVSAWTASGFNGTYYRFVTYSTQLTAGQVAAVSLAMRNEVASRGVAVTAPPAALIVPQLIASGDSITFGQGLSSQAQAWPANLALSNQPAYNVLNYGVSGLMLESINGSEANRAAPLCRAQGGASIYILEGGVNDFRLLAAATPQSVFADLIGTIQTVKRAGCKAYVTTMFSKGDLDAAGNTFESDKNAYDALMLEDAKAAGADGVIDTGAILAMGCDGCNTNTTYFQSDLTHPTAAGQLLLAAAVSNVLNYAAGYSVMNPHYVTTLPYSMTAADGNISAANVTGTGTLTLPDCTGQSGAEYRVNNPQAVFAVSVKALNGNQLINGLAAATTVAVPANGTVVLRDVPNSKTVSGCHWEM